MDEYLYPVHSVGSGVDDFWITFPEINPKAGQPVSHLSWVLDALKTKSLSLLFIRQVVHPVNLKQIESLPLGMNIGKI